MTQNLQGIETLLLYLDIGPLDFSAKLAEHNPLYGTLTIYEN